MIRQILLIGCCCFPLVLVGCTSVRATIATDPPGALVTVNGKEIGPAPLKYTFDFNKEPIYEVKASKSGYIDAKATVDGDRIGIAHQTLRLNLPVDEAFGATTTDDAANHWVRVQVSPKITPAEAWQKIIDSVTDRYSNIEQLDVASAYIRSAAITRTFVKPPDGERIIRTYFVGAISSRKPLVYKMEIVSEQSSSGDDWSPYDRVFKNDAQLIDELQNRLGAK